MSFKSSQKQNNDSNLLTTNVDDDYLIIDKRNIMDDYKLPNTNSKRKSLFSSKSQSNVNVSKSHSKQLSKQSLMTSVVYSFNSSLSAFHNSINRNNMDMAIWKLNDLYFDIKGVWVVAKPIQRINRKSILSKLEHWAIKIHASPALITIDFFESQGYGGFAVEEVCASQAELKDFLYYFPDKKHAKLPWKILSCVVPMKYYNLFDRHNVPMLLYKEQLYSDSSSNNITSDDENNSMDDHKHNNNNDNSNTEFKQDSNIPDNNDIKSNDNTSNNAVITKSKLKSNEQTIIKKVLTKNNDLYELTSNIDINKKVCDIGDWLETWCDTHPHYSSLEANCQRFAYDLYKFLVGTKYPSKPEQLKKQFQSPWDILSKDNDNNIDSMIQNKKNKKYNNPIPRNKIESFDGDFDDINNEIDIEIDID